MGSRAGYRCEYCQLPAQLQVGGFEVDHILPRSRGGLTDMANLAFACPHCNAHKGPNLTGIDPETGEIVPLFNPREHIWEEHCRWSEVTIVGRTAIGRTTIRVLNMNAERRARLRLMLKRYGQL